MNINCYCMYFTSIKLFIIQVYAKDKNLISNIFLNLYLQFLGSTPVDQPKGIEVVKEAIRRLQFSQQMKKAESGNNVKTKKVEITVSINGVAVQVIFYTFF